MYHCLLIFVLPSNSSRINIQPTQINTNPTATMQFTLSILTALLAVAQAQITPPPCSPCSTAIAAVPSCASDCILSAAVTNAGCTDGDYPCQCSQSAAIENAALNCVVADCGLATGLEVLSAVATVCACVTSSGCPAAATAR